MKRIGFIGMGNMAGAMARGFVAADPAMASRMYACARDWDKLRRNAEAIGFTPMASAEALLDAVDAVIIAIKPYQIEDALPPLANRLRDKIVLSVVAGWDFERYESILAPGTHHLYIMPNTPVSVREGVLMLEERHSLTGPEFAEVRELLALLGTVVVLPSHLMNAGMSIAGCGPAFAAMMIEALGDAGVKYGLPRQTAYLLASQTLAGTGKLQIATGAHPGAMKDAVCSPAGTTIRGVMQLEKSGFRGAVAEAIDAILEK